MALRNSFVAIPVLALTFLFASVAAKGQTMRPVTASALPGLNGLPTCVPVAQSGYIGGRCLVTIDRQAPISPPPLLVPPNTTVVVKVTNTKWNENVLFSLATTHTAAPDIAGAALKGLMAPLQTFVLTQKIISALDGSKTVVHDAIDDRQHAVAASLNSVQEEIQHANAAFACLASYQVLEDDYSCSQADLLTPKTFNQEKEKVQTIVSLAATQQLPVLDVKDLDAEVNGFLDHCLKTVATAPIAEQEGKKSDCRDDTSRHLTNEARLNSGLSDIQKAQSTLLAVLHILVTWRGTPPDIAYQFTSSRLNNMVVTITGQEITNKTNSLIATVTINCQATHWVVSTGIVFSNLKFHTFTNAPIIVNGQPVVDSGGKALTRVTRSDTSPSVVAPILFVSYRIAPLSRFKWENKCRNGCSFLLTGGVGANLTSKTADFDSGISLQFGSVLVTPTVHFGRDNRLSNGVTVGTELGPSPPSPLPTENHWVKKFGIAFTYALPTP